MIGQRFTSRVTKRAFIPLPTKSSMKKDVRTTFPNTTIQQDRARLGNNYQLLAKIGWGTSSTVWLARDITRYRWQSERTVALKISNSCDAKSAIDLLGIEETVAQKNPSHLGYHITRSCLESFELKTSDKPHLYLIYEAMREPMSMFQKRFKNRIIPLPIVKAYIQLLLIRLQYLHAECRIVHTEAILRFIQEQVTKLPIYYKTNPITNHTIYQSYHGFGAIDVEDVGNILPRITDFGSVWQFVVNPETKSQNEAVLTYPIQPNYYRAPEVVLGYGWDFSADIWNFGVLVWNIIEGTELFTQVEDANGRYDAKSHLAEMIALLGPPPKGVIERADHMSQVDYPTPIRIEAGKLSKNARELFGGPYFDEEGKFLHEELIPSRKLKDTILSLDDSERELFLSFARDMLTWIPSERKTARELIEHPFLNFGGHVSKDVLEGRS
ncbi:uncharacterized protein N7518_002455 [Penicillium psychrosexuale]|uniref:uncharacterized protein n=1 Tax=Penicillium psychrosexuale TaxID=1002107 RepID=UPI0025456E3B|nr:uncharacterized protein N7518_002455 [Penicillium psychrosexuale]KAJ5800387.1 hypothetical protein N7518_002455 [Penicillium psychrosexuale]